MLPKSKRINSVNLKKIFSGRNKVEHTTLFFIQKTSSDDRKCRFAVVVPKKIAKTAVKRHKIKRKVMSVLNELDIKSQNHIVITVKKDISTFKQQEILSDLDKVDF